MNDEILITAAGGASEAVYMSTFMVGQQLNVLSLFDDDHEGRSQEERLRKKWLTRYKQTKSASVLLSNAVGLETKTDFAIEDLFPVDFYLAKVKETYTAIAQPLKLSGHGLLCNQVNEALVAYGINYNKGSVAKRIKMSLNKMKKADELPQETLEYAKKLFEYTNNHFKS